MKNFTTQAELMKLKEDLEEWDNIFDNRMKGRLSSAAMEEIHRLYTEGRARADPRLVDQRAVHAIRNRAGKGQRGHLAASAFSGGSVARNDSGNDSHGL